MQTSSSARSSIRARQDGRARDGDRHWSEGRRTRPFPTRRKRASRATRRRPTRPRARSATTPELRSRTEMGARSGRAPIPPRAPAPPKATIIGDVPAFPTSDRAVNNLFRRQPIRSAQVIPSLWTGSIPRQSSSAHAPSTWLFRGVVSASVWHPHRPVVAVCRSSTGQAYTNRSAAKLVASGGHSAPARASSTTANRMLLADQRAHFSSSRLPGRRSPAGACRDRHSRGQRAARAARRHSAHRRDAPGAQGLQTRSTPSPSLSNRRPRRGFIAHLRSNQLDMPGVQVGVESTRALHRWHARVPPHGLHGFDLGRRKPTSASRGYGLDDRCPRRSFHTPARSPRADWSSNPIALFAGAGRLRRPRSNPCSP